MAKIKPKSRIKPKSKIQQCERVAERHQHLEGRDGTDLKPQFGHNNAESMRIRTQAQHTVTAHSQIGVMATTHRGMAVPAFVESSELRRPNMGKHRRTVAANGTRSSSSLWLTSSDMRAGHRDGASSTGLSSRKALNPTPRCASDRGHLKRREAKPKPRSQEP